MLKLTERKDQIKTNVGFYGFGNYLQILEASIKSGPDIKAPTNLSVGDLRKYLQEQLDGSNL